MLTSVDAGHSWLYITTRLAWTGHQNLQLMELLPLAHTGNIVAVAGVTEAFDPKQEGENYTRTLMRFENGATATLEMGGCE